jgi:hypothetical protein
LNHPNRARQSAVMSIPRAGPSAPGTGARVIRVVSRFRPRAGRVQVATELELASGPCQAARSGQVHYSERGSLLITKGNLRLGKVFKVDTVTLRARFQFGTRGAEEHQWLHHKSTLSTRTRTGRSKDIVKYAQCGRECYLPVRASARYQFGCDGTRGAEELRESTNRRELEDEKRGKLEVPADSDDL